MPKPSEFEALTGTQRRAYRAIWKLWIANGKCPSSQTEIAYEAKIGVGNLHPILYALEQGQWISKKGGQHRSIVPLVKLPKKYLEE